jgi:hypothetical protein
MIPPGLLLNHPAVFVIDASPARDRTIWIAELPSVDLSVTLERDRRTGSGSLPRPTIWIPFGEVGPHPSALARVASTSPRRSPRPPLNHHTCRAFLSCSVLERNDLPAVSHLSSVDPAT